MMTKFMNDETMRPGEYCEVPKPCNWHEKIKNTIYHGRDWSQPGYNEVLGNELTELHGNLSWKNLLSDVIPKTQIGNIHSVVFDHFNKHLYLAFARPSNGGYENSEAYAQAYIKLDISELLDHSVYV